MSDMILAEYDAMRREIEQRSNAQLALITLNLTAVGALGGFALGNRLDLLLLVAFICPSIGLIWVDHAVTIDNIGDYIRTRLQFRWEDAVVEERVKKFRRWVFGLQIFFLFGFPAAMALAMWYLAHPLRPFTLPGNILEAGWNVGVIFTLMFSFVLLIHIVEPMRQQGRVKSVKPQALWNLGYTSLRRLRDDRYGFLASEGPTADYDSLFGRDSLWILIILLEVLETYESHVPGHFKDSLRDAGVTIIRKLCELQGERDDDVSEEQPGKIIHEYYHKVLPERVRKMNLGFKPDGRDGFRLYSGFDETFLFVTTYRRFAKAFPEESIIGEAWPHVESALKWAENPENVSADGFFAYARRNPRNYPNQVWKDSFDSVTATNADLPVAPVAWVEVQGYAYRAFCEAAELYRTRGKADRAKYFENKAHKLNERVNEKFWVAEKQCLAIALDGEGKRIDMVSSNAGHALWAGTVNREHLEQLVGRLSRLDMTTPYGLRTLSSEEEMYAPYAYHRGCVWPFDNAISAIGLTKNGFKEHALHIIKGVSHALCVIGSPIELYVVLETAPFLRTNPWLPKRREKYQLSLRRVNQRNKNQGWTAAALMYFAAALAGEKKILLRDAPADSLGRNRL